ncbi:MAG: hypothetical protein LBK60_08785 [Verrucomicrobiales bacterium]|jgi:hypothetical protein|nr:hypothetical protein [Verrucomicrobiales bacterium]
MKTWLLIKHELKVTFWIMPYVAFWVIWPPVFSLIHVGFSLSAPSTATFYPLIVMFAGVVFFREFWKNKNLSNAPLEFLFTLPVRRRQIFRVKSSLLAVSLLVPFLGIFAYNLTQPDYKVQLPYQTAEYRENSKIFYLGNFAGARLEKADDGKNENYIHLPSAGNQITAYNLGYVWLLTLLFYGATFGLGWRNPFYFMLFVILPLLWPLGELFFHERLVHKISFYEYSVAWLGRHWLGYWAVLLALTVIVYHFSARKFINAEVR